MIVNEKSKDSCATTIQNFTSYPATLPRGIIGYIEIPITQTTPPHYRVNDVNSLIHSVIHAYHPDTATPIKQNPHADMKSKLKSTKKHFNFLYPLLLEIFDLPIQFEKIFLHYHILQKTNNS